MHCRMSSSIPGLYHIDATSTPHLPPKLVIPKMPQANLASAPGGQNHLRLKTAALSNLLYMPNRRGSEVKAYGETPFYLQAHKQEISF